MAGKIDLALDDVIAKSGPKSQKNKNKPPKPGGGGPKSKFKGGAGAGPSGSFGKSNKFKGGSKPGGSSSGPTFKRPVTAQPRPTRLGGGGSVRGGGPSRFNQGGGYAARVLRPGGGRREESLTVTRVVSNTGEDMRPKAGGIARPRKAKTQTLRAAPYSKGNPDVQWGHDLYHGKSQDPASSPERTRPRMVQTADNGAFVKRALGEKPAKPKQATIGTKVLVSNLDYGVTDSDIRELFGSVGPLVKAEVNKDTSGRSKGTASVIFVKEEDANAAIKEYNGAILDDKAIKLELAPKVIRTVKSTASSSQGSFVVVQERGTSRKIVRRTRGAADGF